MMEKGERSGRVEEWRSGGVECWLDRVKIGFGVEAKYSFAIMAL